MTPIEVMEADQRGRGPLRLVATANEAETEVVVEVFGPDGQQWQ